MIQKLRWPFLKNYTSLVTFFKEFITHNWLIKNQIKNLSQWTEPLHGEREFAGNILGDPSKWGHIIHHLATFVDQIS